jgi:hypothetical protein
MARAKYRPRQYSNAVFYKVVYCPMNSWTDNSAFTRIELKEMLRKRCLFPGTILRKGDEEYIITKDRKCSGIF